MHDSTNNNNENPNEGPLLLTIDEARQVLRISRWSLYKLINGRQLKTIKIGQRRLIPSAELRKFIDDLRQEEASYGR